jgi:hypothetical protein
MTYMKQLQSRGGRPLQMSSDKNLRALVFFRLEKHISARHLLQVFEEYEFAVVK